MVGFVFKPSVRWKHISSGKAARGISSALRAVGASVASMLGKRAMQRAPTAHGKLRQTTRGASVPIPDGVEVIIGSNRSYAPFLEFPKYRRGRIGGGTPANPYTRWRAMMGHFAPELKRINRMKPRNRFRARVRAFRKGGARMAAVASKGKGQTMPYIRRAYYELKDEIRLVLRRKLSRQIFGGKFGA